MAGEDYRCLSSDIREVFPGEDGLCNGQSWDECISKRIGKYKTRVTYLLSSEQHGRSQLVPQTHQATLHLLLQY